MAVLSLSAGTSSINKISSTFINMRRSLSNTRTVISDTKRVILNRTKIKSEAVFRSKTLFQKRQDNIRKKEAEDQLEASSLGSVLSPGFATEKSILNSGKGFLGRILSAIAYLGVGWLLRNLPTWIGMAKEFVARIYKGVAIVKQFFMGAVGFVGNLFNLLGSVAQNIASFDFFDTSNRVKDTFGQLNQNLSDMSSSIDDALRLMTTSLNEGIASGQDAPPLGSEGPSQFPESGTQVGGGLQPIHKQALDIISKYESASAGGYNAMNQGTIRDAEGRSPRSGDSQTIIGKNLTDMTIGEVLAQQNRGLLNRQGFIHAAGRYQFIGITLPGVVKRSGIPLNAKFSPAVQDRLAVQLMIESGGPGPWLADKRTRLLGDKAGQDIIRQAAKVPLGPLTNISTGSSQASVNEQESSPANLRVAPTSRGNFIQGSTGRSTGPHFHFGPGTADAKMAQQGNKFPGTYYSDVRAVAFTVAKHFLSQKKSFTLTRSGKDISPGISDNDLQNALLNEQKVHTIRGSDGGIDMAFSETVRMPLSVADVKFRDDGIGYSGTVAGTNVFVGHGAKGSKSDSFTGSQSMDISSITPSTSGDVVSVVDTRPAIDMQALSQLLNAAAASFNASSSKPVEIAQGSESNMLNNFIRQKFLTDLAYL